MEQEFIVTDELRAELKDALQECGYFRLLVRFMRYQPPEHFEALKKAVEDIIRETTPRPC